MDTIPEDDTQGVDLPKNLNEDDCIRWNGGCSQNVK